MAIAIGNVVDSSELSEIVQGREDNLITVPGFSDVPNQIKTVAETLCEDGKWIR